MRLSQSFDATTIDPAQGGGSMPVGRHPVKIISSEIKATKNDDQSGMVEFTLEILDGPSKGQTGAYRLNLYNKSEQAVNIAQRQFSTLCHVCGVYKVDDTDQLHGIPFIVDVRLQKGEEAIKNGYTEIGRLYDINGNEPGKAGAGNAPANVQQQQPQGGGQGGGWGGNNAGNGQQQPTQQQQPAQGGNGGGWQQPQQQAPQNQQQPAGGGWQAPNGGGNQQQPAGGGGNAKPAWAR